MHPVADVSLAMAIVGVARDLARTVPAPRGAPYFCLDSGAPYDLRILETFSERGIFRKYEFALDLRSGLGGRARWLAARSGCRILGVDPSPSAVAAAMLLNRRAHMEEQVAFQVGQLDSLPLQPRVFTHVWMTDLPDVAQSVATCGEGFRVLRPGGHLAMQCLALSPAARDVLVATLATVGFVNLETHCVECAELPPQCRLARDRLQAAVPQLPVHEQLPVLPAVQIFATRPA
jgi:SAM-dependent methyltransferase